MWGTQCCKNEYEATYKGSKEKYYDYSDNFDQCNGNLISLDSVCCGNDEYINCPNAYGCTGSRGIKNYYIWYSQRISIEH